MNLEFIKENIILNNFSLSQVNYEKLIIEMREDFISWLASMPQKKVNSKKIIDIFKWKGLSTWWINSLNKRDAEVNNVLMKRILFMYLCKSNTGITNIITDDKVMYNQLKINFPKLQIKYKKKLYAILKITLKIF